MPDITNTNTPITTNEDYTLKTAPGREYGISLSGTFGSGTVTFKNSDGTPFKDTDRTTSVTLSAAGNVAVIPTGNQITLTMAGASSPDVDVQATNLGKA
jgi:hypothetical protein